MDMPNETTVEADSSRATVGINLLLGIWVFVSPWVYGAAGNPNAWNSWILGALVAIFALIRLGNPAGARGIAWVNMILGAWLFVSPWVYGYTGNTGRFINSLCAGVIIFALSIYGASTHHSRIGGMHTRTS
jgi:hypothetical protein